MWGAASFLRTLSWPPLPFGIKAQEGPIPSSVPAPLCVLFTYPLVMALYCQGVIWSRCPICGSSSSSLPGQVPLSAAVHVTCPESSWTPLILNQPPRCPLQCWLGSENPHLFADCVSLAPTSQLSARGSSWLAAWHSSSAISWWVNELMDEWVSGAMVGAQQGQIAQSSAH